KHARYRPRVQQFAQAVGINGGWSRCGHGVLSDWPVVGLEPIYHLGYIDLHYTYLWGYVYRIGNIPLWVCVTSVGTMTKRDPDERTPAMKFIQYYLDCLSHASYLIGDETTGRAVVVDPQRDVSEYLADAKEFG